MKDFYKKLDRSKIKISQNKHPIKMKLFLSFLKINTEVIRDHIGSSTGWTKRENIEYSLIIGGGCVGGVEYLDSLQFGKNLSDPWSNYVSPFFLIDILNKEGVSFFLKYYEDDIEEVFKSQQGKISALNEKVLDNINIQNAMTKCLLDIKSKT